MQFSFTIRKQTGQIEVIDATTEISDMTQEHVTHFKDMHAKMGNELLAINQRKGTYIGGFTYGTKNYLEQ